MTDMEKVQVNSQEEIKMGDLLHYFYLKRDGQKIIKKADKENPPNCYAAEDLKGRVVYLKTTTGAVFCPDIEPHVCTSFHTFYR